MKKKLSNFKDIPSGFEKFSSKHQAQIEEIGMIFELLNNTLLNSMTLESKVEKSLQLMKEALDIPIDGVLRYFLNNLTKTAISQIETMVEKIEHIAYLFPAVTPIELLKSIATRNGFPDNHQSFPSTIVSKELGTLCGKEEVPTEIFKAWGKNNKNETIGIEVFIPNIQAAMAYKWIAQGICRHIAIRMKSREDIFEIHKILLEYDPEKSSFKNTAPLVNDKEGSATLYYDKNVSDYIIRLEFFYK